VQLTEGGSIREALILYWAVNITIPRDLHMLYDTISHTLSLSGCNAETKRAISDAGCFARISTAIRPRAGAPEYASCRFSEFMT
jgi:hypothetical protein